MSKDLNWMIIRNNHAFLYNKRNVKKPFSSEPGNLMNVNSPRANGLINKKVIHIEPVSDGKGVVLKMKKTKFQHRLNNSFTETTFRSGQTKTLRSLRRVIEINGYRKDLTKAALIKASQYQRSQRPAPNRSRRAKTLKRQLNFVNKVKASKASK